MDLQIGERLSCTAGGFGQACAARSRPAKIRPTFSSEKNSAGDVTPALTRAKPSIASWLPCTAAEQLLQLGRRRLERRELAGELVHRQDVLVAGGLVRRAIAASKARAPENASSSAVAHSSASRKASLIPWAVMKSLL